MKLYITLAHPGPIFHVRYVGSWNSAGAKEIGVRNISPRAFYGSVLALLAPSWLSSNRAWENRPSSVWYTPCTVSVCQYTSIYSATSYILTQKTELGKHPRGVQHKPSRILYYFPPLECEHVVPTVHQAYCDHHRTVPLGAQGSCADTIGQTYCDQNWLFP